MIELKTVADKVEHILERYPFTRDCDIDLIGVVYVKCYGISRDEPLKEVLNKIKNGYLPAFESIRRSRQKIQESGKYPASEKIAKLRAKNEKEIQKDLFNL